jgi:hypothetical protein
MMARTPRRHDVGQRSDNLALNSIQSSNDNNDHSPFPFSAKTLEGAAQAIQFLSHFNLPGTSTSSGTSGQGPSSSASCIGPATQQSENLILICIYIRYNHDRRCLLSIQHVHLHCIISFL